LAVLSYSWFGPRATPRDATLRQGGERSSDSGRPFSPCRAADTIRIGRLERLIPVYAPFPTTAIGYCGCGNRAVPFRALSPWVWVKLRIVLASRRNGASRLRDARERSIKQLVDVVDAEAGAKMPRSASLRV
jgi:hypothetical protein